MTRGARRAWVVLLACAACAPLRSATSGGGTSVDDESALVARIAGCAHRSPRWVDETFRGPVATRALFGRLLACARASSCSELATCSGIAIDGGIAAESACKPACTGGVEETCGLGPRLRMECARVGQVCSSRGPRCAARDARPCGVDFVPRCDGARPVSCVDGEEIVGDDCAAAGLVCQIAVPDPFDASSRPSAACVGPGPACTGRFGGERPIQCDGDAIVSCAGGHLRRADCNEVAPGSRCRAVGDPDSPSFACLREDACDPTDKKSARCDGDTLTFCNAGHVARVDCARLGFATCLGAGCALPLDRR